MYWLDGRVLPVGQAFTGSDGTRYPENWLALSSADERAAIGIEERADPPAFDERFWWGYSSDGELIPRQLDGEHGLRQQWLKQVRAQAAALLGASDWLLIRQLETGEPVPEAVLQWRRAIRVCSNAREEELLLVGAVADLEALVRCWGPWPTREDR